MDLMLATFACGREEDKRLHDIKFYFEADERFDIDPEGPPDVVVEVIAVEKRGEEKEFKEEWVVIDTRDSWYIYGYILKDGQRFKWGVFNYSTHSRKGLGWGFPLTEEQLANQGYPDMESKGWRSAKRA